MLGYISICKTINKREHMYKRIVHLDLDTPDDQFARTTQRIFARAYRQQPTRKNTQNKQRPSQDQNKFRTSCTSFCSDTRPQSQYSRRISTQSTTSNICKAILEEPIFTQPISVTTFQHFFPNKNKSHNRTQSAMIYSKINTYNKGLITNQFENIHNSNPNVKNKTRTTPSRNCGTPILDPQCISKYKPSKIQSRVKQRNWQIKRKAMQCFHIQNRNKTETEKSTIRQKQHINPWQTLADRDDQYY